MTTTRRISDQTRLVLISYKILQYTNWWKWKESVEIFYQIKSQPTVDCDVNNTTSTHSELILTIEWKENELEIYVWMSQWNNGSSGRVWKASKWTSQQKKMSIHS